MNIYNDFKNQIFEIFLKVTKDYNKSFDFIRLPVLLYLLLIDLMLDENFL